MVGTGMSFRTIVLSLALGCLGTAIGPAGTTAAAAGQRAVPTPSAPFARSQSAMAWDGRGVLLFGGENTGAVYNDTWRWSGNTWTLLAPRRSPPPREAMG